MNEQTANFTFALVCGLLLAKPVSIAWGLFREWLRFRRNCRNARKARGY